MKKSVFLAALAAASPAWADDPPTTLSTPSMFGPLSLNPSPYGFDAGPAGKIYASGVISGLGMTQTHPVPHDQSSLLDLSNAQLMLQKTDGPIQFYLQGGQYILPGVGAAYQRSAFTTDHFFGPLPIAYVKIAPSDSFSIQAGKLYTLIGTENTFDFQTANIQHGLLWNQTNDLSRGVQVNYSHGPWSGSLALTDGYYSDKLNWLSGALTYTIDANNNVTLLASGNFRRDSDNTLSTPATLNNSQLAQLNYSYTAGPWLFSPTLQWTHVPEDPSVGLAASASTYGAGLTTKYAINATWNIAARAEYIASTGGTNVMYGPGSNGWAVTLTPTWQKGMFFARPEASFVKALATAPGAAFGRNGNETTQARLLFETGVIF
ncbi:MAG: outer membrane beta-barrel protein [Pseudomonadota bacterium]|nr:outer membrane beta-barrel protein [Pseudomonadota bacterium]